MPTLSLGDAELQRDSYWSQVYQRTQSQWVTWACYALIASAGLFFMALYWFDRTQRYILWISLTWLCLADLRINEFLVSASIHYSSHLEFLLYSLGNACPSSSSCFSSRSIANPFRSSFASFLESIFLPGALLVAGFLPLHAGVALRWHIEVEPTMTTIELLTTLAAAFPRPWHSGRCDPCARTDSSGHRLFRVGLMDFAYMTVQFPFLNLDIESLFLRIQPYRSMAIAAVVVSMTILLVQQLRTTNQERAELHGEMASAREIQQYLSPNNFLPLPGWPSIASTSRRAKWAGISSRSFPTRATEAHWSWSATWRERDCRPACSQR